MTVIHELIANAAKEFTMARRSAKDTLFARHHAKALNALAHGTAIAIRRYGADHEELAQLRRECFASELRILAREASPRFFIEVERFVEALFEEGELTE